MGRTGKDKGKAVEGSSSNPGEKRRRVTSDEAEEQRQAEQCVFVKPDWLSGPLTDIDYRWQPQLFVEKMDSLSSKREAFICEKEISEAHFGPFRVFDRFQALGWEAALSCYDSTNKYLYMDEIEEWVSTLKCPPYKKPSEMKLVGQVNGVSVTMSFESLRQIAKFDSKKSSNYEYPHLDDLYFQPERHPRWNDMVSFLFAGDTGRGKLLRKNLDIEAKLLLLICINNVIPRRSDKFEVRYPEVPILYALMNGGPLISFRYLVLNNIWISRNSVNRKIVPHCRLIAALLKRAGVITEADTGVMKRHRVFDFQSLGMGWTYSQSERYYKLKIDGQTWRALKPNARPLRQGEEDEPMSDAEQQSASDDDDEEGDDEEEEAEEGEGPPTVGEVGSSRLTSGRGFPRAAHARNAHFDYADQQFNQNWAHDGSMREMIQNARPPTYYHWTGSSQALYDHQTFMGANAERATKAGYDRQEAWNRAHQYAYQQEINDRYRDDRSRRMHDAWHSGQPVVADPPVIDYTTLPPYDGSISYPTPAIHHSRWVDPNQDQQMYQQMYQQPQSQQGDASQAGGGGGEQGAFGFGEFQDIMTSIFGPPGPPYY